MNIPSLLNLRPMRSASKNHINPHAPPQTGGGLTNPQPQVPHSPRSRFQQYVPVALHQRGKNPMTQSSRQVYTQQIQLPCNPYRSYAEPIKPLGSPFRSPNSRCASVRPCPPGVPQPYIQPHPRKPEAYPSGISPLSTCAPSTASIGVTSAFSSTISRFNDNCQSTLDRIRADIDALHAHYQDIIRKEKAATERARALARTLEAERDTAREMVFKIMEDQRTVKKEHITPKCSVVRTKLPSPNVNEKEHRESGKKRKRGCLTAEALSQLTAEQAEIPHGSQDDSTSDRGTHPSGNAVERVGESPPLKKFKLEKRSWTPGGSAEGQSAG